MTFLNRKKENNMIYRVKEPFSYTDGRGVPRVMRVGDLVTTDHDAYREKWSHLFEPVNDAAERVATAGTETATAAPGEKRSVPSVDDAAQKAEVERLQGEAEAAGVKVDKRWGTSKLRQEIDAARKAKGSE